MIADIKTVCEKLVAEDWTPLRDKYVEFKPPDHRSWMECLWLYAM
jgi:hypothetical protein